ncbi:MAG: formate dehydrogenase accessory sulfurtransferase FdhD [Candidatus Bathyarchaeota archaeon]|nr:formate dehydrogenase accessory sulfurtransferase FdhD [Candidatus Bathyarchaeota archaeon]
MTNETLKTVAKIKARKIDLDKRVDKFEEELVAIEAPVKFFLNEEPLTTIMALPSNLKEMAIGFLVDEGIIPGRQDILNITIDENEVWVKSKKVDQKRLKSIIEKGVILTSCSSRADFYRVIGEIEKRPLKKNHYVEAKDIYEMVKESTSKSTLFRTTGGVHSASIFVDNILRGFVEDVGRHNAVDKAIGICLDNDIQLERAILITSGRQTADTIIKAARCKIPISVSMRAPLSSGIYAAELTGITLICFVRGQKMNIYSHPERVKFL